MAGAATATLFVVSFVILIALIGDFTIIEIRPTLQLVTNFLNFTIGSLLQEFILLCVIYRLVEEMAGSWIALFTTNLGALLALLQINISPVYFIASHFTYRT